MVESLIVLDDKDSVGTKSIRLRLPYYYYLSISVMNCCFSPKYEMETSIKTTTSKIKPILHCNVRNK